MGFWSRLIGTETRGVNPLENPTIPISASADEMMAFFGVSGGRANLPVVTIERALKVPAVGSAVGFLSRSLASVPLHSYVTAKGETKRANGDLQMLINEAPNPEWSSREWRRYMWQQVFTGGRGLTWIERVGGRVVALWPMDPDHSSVARVGGRKIYRFNGREYPASDVIDVPFMLKNDQVGARGPIALGHDAIQLAIAMQDFGAQFFAGGGVPPLSLEGPMPQGVEAFKRAHADIQRSIDTARKSGTPFFGMPPGHSVKQVGYEPAKGQMTEQRLFQLQEIARVYGLPPVFLQDLSKGTLNNVEHQDIQLVKHVISQWAGLFEDELNLKLFGQRRRARHVEHNLDGMQRGALKDRIEALSKGVTSSLLTPNEARELDNRPPKPHGDKLYMQGANVPLGSAPIGHNGGPPLEEKEEGDDDAERSTED